jgi:hypothetical protein
MFSIANSGVQTANQHPLYKNLRTVVNCSYEAHKASKERLRRRLCLALRGLGEDFVLPYVVVGFSLMQFGR